VTRILVTGGTGFIGSALVRRLIGAGNQVCNVDALTYAASPDALAPVDTHPSYQFERGDIADHKFMRSVIDDFQPQSVFNLAAESHVDRSIETPLQFVRTNVLGTATLLDEVHRYWAQASRPPSFRFVHVSTDEVFGTLEAGSFNVGTPYDPRSPYAASKAGGDHLVRAWFHTFGLPTIVTNCSNNYGPFQFPEKLIPLMTISAIDGRVLPVYGDGMNVRDWIFVDDHVDGLVAAWERGTPGETYMFGARQEETNLEVVKAICQIIDELAPTGAPTSDRIELVGDRPGHDRRYSIDPTAAEVALSWTARTAFHDGLRKTVRWYLESADWWRPLIKSGAVDRRGQA